jgi:hypothetical protein
MPSASMAKMAETTAYDAVRTNPFTPIHGHPTRNNYRTLKKEASDLASKVEDIMFDWAQDTNTGDEYGLLTEIIGEPEYTLLTGNQWVQEVELAKYDPAITAATATHTRKQMEEEWEEGRTSWYIRKGFLCGVMMNMHDALNEAYYSQLKHIMTADCNTTPIQILKHLDKRWCPLDIRVKKQLKGEFIWIGIAPKCTSRHLDSSSTKSRDVSNSSEYSSGTKINSNSTWNKSTLQTCSQEGDG